MHFRSWLKRLQPLLGPIKAIQNWTPLSPLGFYLSLSAVLALYFSKKNLDLVLLVAAYACLGLVLISALVVSICALWVKHALKTGPALDPIKTETDRRTLTGFRFSALRFVPFVRVSWNWGTHDVFVQQEQKGRTRHEWVTFSRRHYAQAVSRYIRVQGVLGFSKIVIEGQRLQDVLVLPHLGRFRELPHSISLAGGYELSHPKGTLSGDRVDVRRYLPTDPARFIHWKMFSRTQTLMLRAPENALAESWETYCYLVSGKNDEASAALARAWLEELARSGADWCFGADRASSPTRDLYVALNKIAQSASSGPDDQSELDRFIRDGVRTRAATLHLFVPPEEGPWLGSVTTALRRNQVPTCVWIGVEHLIVPKEQKVLNWLWYPPDEISSSRKRLNHLARHFRGLAAQVTVVERKSGLVHFLQALPANLTALQSKPRRQGKTEAA